MAAVGLPRRSSAGKGSAKGKARVAADGSLKQYSVTHNEFLPCRTLLMYPNRDDKTLTKSPADGLPLYEDMNGVDMLNSHGILRRRDGKSVEELGKCAVGISEHAACLLQFLQVIRGQVASTNPCPILNPALLPRLVTKLSDYEHSLEILDLSRELPRSADDITSAVRNWLTLGKELAKPAYAAFFQELHKIVPYLTLGSYRCKLASAMGMHPDVVLANMSKEGEQPLAQLNAWQLQPTNFELMVAFFAASISARINGFAAAPAAAVVTPAAQNALAAMLEASDDETVAPAAPAAAAAKPAAKRSATPKAAAPAAAAPAAPAAAAATAGSRQKRKRCEWCEEIFDHLIAHSDGGRYCDECTAASYGY